MARWVTLGKLNDADWQPVMGARWRRRGTRIVAQGQGDGFGGRSLLLSQSEVPETPFELAVSVKLDDEDGAAGLAFFSDGGNKHYGFYPSGGKLRLTCFRGPSVFSWEILDEVESESYLPGQWNQLKVRVEDEAIKCFVNGQLVIESGDRQLRRGKAGLAKFRDTKPEFRGFRIGGDLGTPELSEQAQAILAELKTPLSDVQSIGEQQIRQMGRSNELAARELVRQALQLEQQAEQLRKLASDVRLAGTLGRLRELDEVPEDQRLLTGSLLIAALDDPDVDIQAYRRRVDEMAAEISETLDGEASPPEIRDALHRYLFDENGFHGSRSEYYHRANSHISRVIDDREGLPITLSILYMELGRRLGLTLDGIGLPGHFVVRHAWGDQQTQLIDVFDRGKSLSDSDAESLVMLHAGRLMRPADKQTQSTEQILTRVLNNLIGVAAREQDGEGMLRYCEAMVAIDPESTEFRLMRIQLRGMTGRTGLAIEDLNTLLESDLSDRERAGAMRLRRALDE
jgi:regulator of sirC expression with transglutaminase-like and TPR domain